VSGGVFQRSDLPAGFSHVSVVKECDPTVGSSVDGTSTVPIAEDREPTGRSVHVCPFESSNAATELLLNRSKWANLAKELEVWNQQFAKSIKADDAHTPVHLLNSRVFARPHNPLRVQRFQEKYAGCPLDAIHLGLLARWRRNVRKSFLHDLSEQYGIWQTKQYESGELRKDLAAGWECLWRAASADWWEWKGGSRPFFWRWPEEHGKAARYGYPLFIQSPLPSYKRPQPLERDPSIRQQVQDKLLSVREKKYIDKGEVRSLTSYFSVPKGDKDIRMVYDATKSKLNGSLWAPNFGLPTIDTMVRGIKEESWLGDIDIGEMFLNFMLHPSLQPYAGVDLRPYFGWKGDQTKWERWVRCLMGLKPSPYVCIKALLLALECARGNRHDPNNPFQWDHVVQNLPGTPSYDPSQPQLSRVQEDGHTLASLVLSYVDNMRTAAGSEQSCWDAMHIVS